MSGFDATERPLWTLVGAAYLRLLEPLRDRPARTLRQIGAHPRRDDLENRGYALMQSPARVPRPCRSACATITYQSKI